MKHRLSLSLSPSLGLFLFLMLIAGCHRAPIGSPPTANPPPKTVTSPSGESPSASPKEAGGVVFSGNTTQPLKITKSGTYQFGPGATITIDPQRTRQGVIACEIKASNVVIDGLTVVGGFRGFSIGGVQNVTLRNSAAKRCGFHSPTGIRAEAMRRAGMRGAPPVHLIPELGPESSLVAGATHGGSNVLCWNGGGLTLENFQSLDVLGEHGLYIAQTWTGATLKNTTISNTNPGGYTGVFQINSESGSGVTNVVCTGCTFKALNNFDNCAFMGAGTASKPIAINDSTIVNGRRALIATNYAAGRKSYVALHNTPVTGKQVTEGGSWIHKL
jgi:hypothetical protein